MTFPCFWRPRGLSAVAVCVPMPAFTGRASGLPLVARARPFTQGTARPGLPLPSRAVCSGQSVVPDKSGLVASSQHSSMVNRLRRARSKWIHFAQRILSCSLLTEPDARPSNFHSFIPRRRNGLQKPIRPSRVFGTASKNPFDHPEFSEQLVKIHSPVPRLRNGRKKISLRFPRHRNDQ